MKYPQLSALVPQGEHFDATAINEGVWLSQGHVNAVELTLAGHSDALAAVKDQLTSVTSQYDAAVLAQQQAETGLETANTTIADQKSQIDQLQAKVTELENKTVDPQNTSREKDEQGKSEVPSYADPNNPANAAADRLMGRPGTKAK